MNGLRSKLMGLLLGALPLSASAQVPDLYELQAYRSIHLTFSQSNWWNLLEQNYSSQTEIPADMTVDGVVYPSVGVRFRGNTSYTRLPRGSEKKSFNIRTDSYIAGQDIYGYDHLNLNNGFHDPTFLREFLTYLIMRRHGPAPKCNFVKLYLNGAYWGVYINVQQPNKDMMKEWFRSNDGNRYRAFPPDRNFRNGRCALTWLGSSVQSYLAAYDAKQGDGTDLMQMIDVLNNTPSSQLQALLPAEFSVDSFYRYAAVMNITTQTDSYIGTGKDHFLYRDEVHGIFHTFPFDVNESLQESVTLDPWYNTTNSERPAFSKTLQFTDWRQRYIAHYRSIVEESFNWAELGPIVNQFHAMISADVIADTKKIYTTQQFLDNITQSVRISSGPGGVTIPALQTLIVNRSAYLLGRSEFSAPRTTLMSLQHTPQNPTAGNPVVVTVDASSHAASLNLYWRALGPFSATPMYDDGLHGDGAAGDGTWGASVPPAQAGQIIDYYVEAVTAGGLVTYLPSTAEHKANQFRIDWPSGTSPVLINEFVAQNVNGIVDQNNQHEDWLELYNSSVQAIDVSGMYLTDDLSQLKFQIPAGTTIAGHGTLHVWCDEDGTQGPLHANFKLSAGGEEIGLFASDGMTLVGSYQFGPQVADVATGALIDGAGPMVSLDEPTPYQVNASFASGYRRYSALDFASHTMLLDGTGTPTIGSQIRIDLSGGPLGSPGIMFFGASGGAVLLPGFSFTLLVDPVGLQFGNIYLDAAGAWSAPIQIPSSPWLVGAPFYLQIISFDGQDFPASNGLEIVFG